MHQQFMRNSNCRRTLLAGLFILLQSRALPAENLQEIMLWPDGMPEPAVPAEPPEKTEVGKDGIFRRYFVSRPRLLVHRPPAGIQPSGAGMIVVPGGGFTKLADGHEGADVCEWLAGRGIVAFQLIHRTPTNEHSAPNAGPIQDAQKAVLEVRKRTAEWNVQPGRLGMLGFSAGGQVALIASSNPLRFEHADTTLSHKPDLMLAIYPYQIYDAEHDSLRNDIHVDSQFPPTFIAQMGDDKASLSPGSALLYLALVKNKIPAELHIYERGGHGFGMRKRDGATGPTDWPLRAADWLQQHGYANPQ